MNVKQQHRLERICAIDTGLMIIHHPIPGHVFGEATYQQIRTGDDSILTFAEAGLLRGNTIRCDSEKQVCAIERSRPQSQSHLSVDLSLSRADTIIFGPDLLPITGKINQVLFLRQHSMHLAVPAVPDHGAYAFVR